MFDPFLDVFFSAKKGGRVYLLALDVLVILYID